MTVENDELVFRGDKVIVSKLAGNVELRFIKNTEIQGLVEFKQPCYPYRTNSPRDNPSCLPGPKKFTSCGAGTYTFGYDCECNGVLTGSEMRQSSCSAGFYNINICIDPTQLNPEPALTASPSTGSPTTLSPTTKSPTTNFPTQVPSSSPTTNSPTTKSPTKQPSSSPTVIIHIPKAFFPIPSGIKQKMVRLCMSCNERVEDADSTSCDAMKKKLREEFCAQETVNQENCNGLDKIEYALSDYCTASNGRRLASGTSTNHEFRMFFKEDSPALPMDEKQCDDLSTTFEASSCQFGAMDSTEKFEPYTPIGNQMDSNSVFGMGSGADIGIFVAIGLILVAIVGGLAWFLNSRNGGQSAGNPSAQRGNVAVQDQTKAIDEVSEEKDEKVTIANQNVDEEEAKALDEVSQAEIEQEKKITAENIV